MRYILVVLALCLLGISAQAGTFRDDFEDGNLDGWGNTIDACPPVKSEWKVDKGILVGRYPIVCGSHLLFGEPEWRNYSIECDAKMVEILTPDWYAIALGLRVQESFRGVYCAVGKRPEAEATIEVVINVYTRAKAEWNKDFKFRLRWYHLKGVASEENFEFYVDGELLISLKDSVSPTGYLALGIMGSIIHFDNVVITGDDVPGNSQAVSSPGKLATSWGQMKSR